MTTPSDINYIIYKIPKLLLLTSLLTRIIPEKLSLKKRFTGKRGHQKTNTIAGFAMRQTIQHTIAGHLSVLIAITSSLDTELEIA